MALPSSATLRAQDSVAISTAGAARAGVEAANRFRLREKVGPAVLAGVSFGAGGRLIAADIGRGAAAAGAVVGVALLFNALGEWNPMPPPMPLDKLSATPVSQRMFEEAFHQRLKERQRRAVLIGAIAGAIIGASVVQLMIPSIFGG